MDGKDNHSESQSLHGNTTIPDEVVEEVERLLREQRQASENLVQEDRRTCATYQDNIKFGICDFGGSFLNHSLYQVMITLSKCKV